MDEPGFCYSLAGGDEAPARELGDRATEAKVLWGMLMVEYWGGGDSYKAQVYGQQSLVIARELGLEESLLL